MPYFESVQTHWAFSGVHPVVWLACLGPLGQCNLLCGCAFEAASDWNSDVALQARELRVQVSKVPTQQFITVAPAQQQAMR
jgi:hypothetical protein